MNRWWVGPFLKLDPSQVAVPRTLARHEDLTNLYAGDAHGGVRELEKSWNFDLVGRFWGEWFRQWI